MSTPFIEEVKGGEGRLMGFGHRVYKNYDPRAGSSSRPPTRCSRSPARTRSSTSPSSSRRSRSSDEYFVNRKLYPNVDFYSGLIYQAMGFPVEMFTVLFAIPRMAGWLAHWDEMLDDKDQKIPAPASGTPATASATTSRSATAERHPPARP